MAKIRFGSDPNKPIMPLYHDDSRLSVGAFSTRTGGFPGDRSLGEVHHWEHVVRFSRKMLGMIGDTLARKNATLLHGENFASSLCLWNSKRCTTADLRDFDAWSNTLSNDNDRLGMGICARAGIYDIPPHSRAWYHVPGDRLCELLGKKWAGDRAALALVRAHCEGPPLLDGAGVVRGRAHVLSSASVGPLGRLIVLGAGMQTCARTCAMGEDAAWMCVDPAEWRASLRRSENASQAEA